MGKIRIKNLGDEDLEKKQKKQAKKRQEAKKTAKEPEVKVDEPIEAHEVKTEEPKTGKQKTENRKQKTGKQKAKPHSKRYQSAKVMVEPHPYTLEEALNLLEKLQKTKFDETVELHINTIEPGITGNLTLPHGTGKKTKVAIADDKLIADVEKGKIDFDILLAEPSMMPKLAKVARVLGPRGLMPNPKNGTITTDPQEAAKKYEGGQIRFKTEAKTPVIHLSVGKISFGEKKLSENIKTVLSAIQSSKIRNATLKSTMSPGIKVDCTNI